MTKEEELYYNNYFDLFGSEGWKQVVEELQAKASMYDVSYIKDEKDLYRVQGELSVIRLLLGLEEFINQGYSNTKESN
jgi:hypothetical protein